MLVNMKQLLEVAKENKFAVGAFNVADSNFLRVVVEEAEKNNAPAIIAVHPTELDFTKDDFFQYVLARIKNSPVPFVLHLDHGDNMGDVMRAVRCGFSSVMIDGSLLPFEENIRVTKEVVDVCHKLGVSVEGELGTIGKTGNSIEGGVSEIIYTKPEEAEEYISRTGVDTLAVAIGTAHGIYPKDKEPKLRLDILKEIKALVNIPLVLHGGSANPDAEIAAAVEIGIQKVNISSDYKYAFYKKCREILSTTELWDANAIYPDCIDAAKEVVKYKMGLFESIGQVEKYQQAKTTAWRSELI
ncbi:ketose-bisphosphate aldolase [Listeria monocytogenes]|jgi:fructose-bisphosphate aldolase (EC 4.1.2.13)|uniref:Lmo2133 protein n=8 Tax=Listeria monocytogenes TaxID=1639 RepID=Q8Y5D2_LISMO|nr:ketose-bisphosphate aldolase [Listeria monocytogenes]NP_465657.1 fructose-1,6-biphosphate aldolase type II [Listeria monocytogenes EGD-e]EAA0166342.1 ketose-bisphosphate aldolase [Listeria monocytogenes serotype 1/2a]EAD3236816.1 ketose-bisphosphate aldolase [Listeria monocytogenes CFSAN002202]EAE3701911.1 ketose-bisphosphate aldolase [Listeria monocytogenes serotype 1/2c]EAE6021597.1 ketose-bisphosphate aldolase [Listeria monocytogenes serotype 3a]EAF4502161.1 ketose-bisphosphate aldolase